MRCWFCNNKYCQNFGNEFKEFPDETPCPDYDYTSDVLSGFEQNFSDIDDYD